MKSRFFLSLSYFVLITFLFSCKDEGESGVGTLSKVYFISFKANGVSKFFHVSNPGYQSCGECACSMIPPLSSEYGDINICNDANDWITGAHIESWNGSSIEFSGSEFPIASFYYTLNGVDYSTALAGSQTGSEISITSVSPDGTFNDLQMYTVRGTFQCHVRADGAAEDVVITEGDFFVRYSED